MAFCRNCGAQIADENAICESCSGAGAYYQPAPYGPPPVRSPDEEVGKALGIVALIIIIVVVVTVILAAVLYVMVIGMSGPMDFMSTPVGSWNGMEATSSTTAKLTFGHFSEDVVPTDLQIMVREGGSGAGYILWTGDTSSTTVDMDWVGGPAGAYAEYSDFNPTGGEIDIADFITLSGLEPDTTYSIEVYHLPTDSVVYMGGGSTFTTEP